MLIPEKAKSILRTPLPRLGECVISSPLLEGENQSNIEFVPEERRVFLSTVGIGNCRTEEGDGDPLSYEAAGARRKIFFDPTQTRAAIVTCGGLCPGINDVIRRLVLTLDHMYGLREIFGIRYGYRGMVDGLAEAPVLLTPSVVEPISNEGGTYLGTSRGNQDPVDMVDFLERRRIRILFSIGGDGTQRGALAIADEAEKRGYTLSVVGLPKTIDNDIGLVERTFGFDSAVETASRVLRGAHVEAEAEYNGVMIVKLMGRQSGFLAVQASIASGDVNYILIPEVPFDIGGPNGFLESLRSRLERRHHALVVVAEGVSAELLQKDPSTARHDASGNLILEDIGVYLKNQIASYFKEKKFPARIKYIDPSYYVRSLPANSHDSIYCQNLANNAAHAGLSGCTKVLIATCNGVYCHVPLEAATLERKFVSMTGSLWRSALESTGQPLMRNEV